MARFMAQMDERQTEILAELKACARKLGIKFPEDEDEAHVDVADVVDNPEQQPHADQDAIDAAFSDLMAGIDF